MTDRSNSENHASNSGHSTPHEPRFETWLTRFIREPLFHFLVLGSAFFVVYGYLHRDDAKPQGDQQIFVTEGKIEHLATLFTRTWQRPPTREELNGLVDDYVREEAAYREGTAMGLDRDDTIIRRRIRQKLEFVTENLTNQLQPTDVDLETYLQEHQDDFRLETKFTFRQVFFDRQKHGERLTEIVNGVVVKLREDASVDAREQGDRTLLEFEHQNVSYRDVANSFGNQFADALTGVDTGIWQGPLESPYGVHLVIIDQVLPGKLPKLEDVRNAVRREWEHAQRQELTERYYRNLVNKYDVVIQWPEVEAK